jgi:hypothetical protein
MHIVLGDGDTPMIAWIESEIDEWIEQKKRARGVPETRAQAG